jgi:N-hydroxyarylamine O-acetyltransferase
MLTFEPELPVTDDFSPDLDAYFARIGYTGARTPTLPVLASIVRAHIESIPFENLDVLLGAGIDLEPRAVWQKLVHSHRGGYCFEQNSLLLDVLTALGFAATPLSARVRLQRPRDFTPPRSHMFVRVELDGIPWLADVGVGAMSPTAPLRFDTEAEQSTPHEPRRLLRDGDWDGLARRSPTARIFHQVRFGSEWQDVAELTLEPMPPIDREVANWFTSAHPRSHFRSRLVVARATTTGRITLLNRELTFRGPDGVGETQVLASPAALLGALAEHFGLHFPAGTEFPCEGLVWG